MSLHTKSDITLLPMTARTIAVTSSDQLNTGDNTLLVYLNVTAASGTGGLTLRLDGKEMLSGSYAAFNAAPTAVTATGLYVYMFGPGCTTTGGSVAQSNAILTPAIWRISMAVGDSSSYTYSVTTSVLV